MHTTLRFFLLIWIMTTFLPLLSLEPQRLGILSHSINPAAMAIMGEEIFVIDGSQVAVYGIKDGQFKRQFGKEGEGPGELSAPFFWVNALSVSKPHLLMIEGFNKLLEFDARGSVVREEKKMIRAFRLQPLGQNFIATPFPAQGDKNGKASCFIQILGPKQDVLQTLMQIPEPMFDREGLFQVVPSHPQYEVHEGLLYLETPDKPDHCRIDVYTPNGQRKNSLSYPVKPVAIDAGIKARLLGELERSFQRRKDLSISVPVTVQTWDDFRKWAHFEFPDTLPAIRDFWVDRDHVFIQTQEKTTAGYRFIVMSTKGEKKGEFTLPVFQDPVWLSNRLRRSGARRALVHQGFFYFLHEDEDAETWEIRRLKIPIIM